ncbi:MAG: DASS family sodium-coupled anion symporter [Bacteroidetes bacterium]|nr:DASS family sodium-coupled anion symporter [Bacteroidota bacterium]
MVDKNSDFLNMNNYRIEKLPVRIKSKVETRLQQIGSPLAVIAFIIIYFFLDISFLQNIDAEKLSSSARVIFDRLGTEHFSHSNVALLAIFAAALILWITEAIPNYLTSLILIIALVLTKVLPEKEAYAQLGHKVMWLNILSFILASMLVATGVAKRFALWFIVKFGKNSTSVFFSFIVINLVLSMFISATTAKATILLPIFMVVAVVYGATGGKNKNNFGRNLVLQNLFQINISASAFVTGSGANLLAASLIAGAIGSELFFFDWMQAAAPVAFLLILIAWFVGTKIIFKIPKEEKTPQIKGGMEKLKEELDKLGKIKFSEIKAIIIFSSILGLWVTDRLHGISPTAVAFMGAIIALMPKIGVVKWNDVDIPWHLLLFSAGAYTLGEAFKFTDLPSLSVNAVFDALGLGMNTPFWLLYMILTGAMTFSALIFQSKTMRAMLFVPIAIGVAGRFGFPIVSLAFPVAMLIEHVYVLPFNSKPALLLYSTDHYSLTDTFKFGFVMLVIAWVMSIVMGQTYFQFLGITPNGVF